MDLNLRKSHLVHKAHNLKMKDLGALADKNTRRRRRDSSDEDPVPAPVPVPVPPLPRPRWGNPFTTPERRAAERARLLKNDTPQTIEELNRVLIESQEEIRRVTDPVEHQDWVEWIKQTEDLIEALKRKP